jgi:hypothetical protein
MASLSLYPFPPLSLFISFLYLRCPYGDFLVCLTSRREFADEHFELEACALSAASAERTLNR